MDEEPDLEDSNTDGDNNEERISLEQIREEWESLSEDQRIYYHREYISQVFSSYDDAFNHPFHEIFWEWSHPDWKA
ncbi:MAG: hypothetical protein WAQ27_06325 [Candidatus Microsaccharimonas sp.]